MKTFIFIILVFQVFTISTTAESGIAFLPPYGGSWYVCVNITAVVNKSFSVKLVDDSTPATTGFGDYVKGNTSLKRIYDIGFEVRSYVIGINDTNPKDVRPINPIYYCNTSEYSTTQCDSQFMGLPLPNQIRLPWCLSILNPYNNSQKAYVSLGSDETYINSNNTYMSTNGMAHNINNEYLLLVLLILFQMLWEYFC
ncbi:hypothetical protein F8M41_021214 [Gigaspora margarita]|uniref:Uncharacterized protein n=1 Tax=Gigaspora margarita TaxID=4874 RepID=A0A8H4EJ43_GIGMA|nr:hypothetical protein F8M41_021214 [Gigaspora margarita]